MQSFLSKLNIRLLVVHFIAFLFFTLAFQVLGHLHDYQFLFHLSEHMNRLNFLARFNADMEFVQQAGNIGLLAAYVISWFICTKHNWHWLNSVLVFLLLFLLKNFVLPKWVPYNKVVMRPGGLFNVQSLWGHIIMATLFIALGLLIFFSKKLIKYIEGVKPDDKKGPKGKKAGK